MNAKELFNSIPQTEAELRQFQAELKETAEDGFTDSLTAFARLTELHKAIQEVAESIKEDALKEAQNYSGATFEHKGFIFAAKKGGRMYDFSACGDQKYNQIEDKLSEAKKEKEDREAMLKTIKEAKQEFDPETGEVYEIMPPAVTYKKDSLIVKFNG